MALEALRGTKVPAVNARAPDGRVEAGGELRVHGGEARCEVLAQAGRHALPGEGDACTAHADAT